MNKNLHVVVMAGGTGTRLWPLSRQNKPKQFLDVLGTGRSLLQMTTDRFDGVADAGNLIIASNLQYESILKNQFPKYSKHQFFLEPSKKNTAPCIAFAAYKLAKKYPDAVMVVSPADHAIFKEEKFLKSIELAVKTAEEGKLVTIGIKPNRPETGYGYIQYLEGNGAVKKVKTFTEKPELDLAKKFLESGDFVWNAGIFVWSVKAIIEAFEKYDPSTAEIFEEGNKYFYTWKEKKFVQAAYAQCRNISIDYAIMEKAENVHVVLGDFGWSDLGSWGTVYDLNEKDDNGNVLSEGVQLLQSSNNLVSIPKDKVAVIEGLENFLIVDAGDVLLICPKNESNELKDLMREAKKVHGDRIL